MSRNDKTLMTVVQQLIYLFYDMKYLLILWYKIFLAQARVYQIQRKNGKYYWISGEQIIIFVWFLPSQWGIDGTISSGVITV